ncbi:MAG: hypothetical protein Q4A82_05630 [Corynebacterium sp.]|nr:hypothetical protein [Corynebacterium sp.]
MILHQRTTIAVILLCCALGVSGCALMMPLSLLDSASDSGTTGTDATETKAPTSLALGSVIEAGTATFNPDSPDFRLFNICTKLTTQQWEAAGLRPMPE